jgi:hypothetical protein
MSKQSWNGFSSSTQTPTLPEKRDASNPFFSHYPNSLDTEGKMRKSSRGKNEKKPFTGFPHES